VSTSVKKQAVSGHDDLIDLVFSFTIQPGWHVYGPDNGDDGPTKMTFNTEQLEGCQVEGGLRLSPAPKRVMDNVFGCEVTYFENKGSATQRLRLKGGAWKAVGYLEYGTCNDESCMPPTPVEFSFEGTLQNPGSANTPSAASPARTGNSSGFEPPVREGTVTDEGRAQGKQDGEASTDGAETDTTSQIQTAPSLTGRERRGALWTPVIDELHALDAASDTQSRSLWGIFFLGIIGGLIALLTPCVWPIIPMTVSFFLKRSKDDKRKGIKDAILYGLSIVVIYVALGLLVTLIWGPSSLNALSTNAIFNLFLFALLVVFAASFLGGFEITLPSSWSTKMDEKASSTTGLLSIFFMALTLVLVSFSCTGPIIGLLLVDMVTSGSIIAPTVGMFGFALALAAPFTLFAMFPTWLKSAPKSGNWMNVIKVVLGLVELAFALKFLSVADLAYGWRLLDRETFLCLWILIFALMGFYLLGWIRLPHDEDEYDDDGNVITRPKIGVVRFLSALCVLAFALYMVPGLWGAPCKAVSAFAPPMWTQDFNLNQNTVEATYTDYEEGMAAARRLGKPAMLDFTGFGCVNCRKMEAAVWPDARVRQLMTEDYVLVSLYVDDKTPLPAPVEVIEADGTTRKLRTIGDRWSYLQRTKFGAQTQPFYVLVDHEARPLAGSFSYKEDIPGFVSWLEGGLQRFKENK
jgi:thiol:disulfide interchange protein DsbD